MIASTDRSIDSSGRGLARRWDATVWASRVALVTVVIGTCVAAVWATGILWRRLDGLAAGAYDLAFFQQVIWSVGADGTWTSSFHDGSFLGLHFSPILVVPAVLERLTGPDPHVLSLLHALAIAALVPATFLFVGAMLRPSRHAAIVAASLAVPVPVWATTQWVLRSDFHPELVGVVLALLAGWAGLGRRTRTMWLLAAIALLTREDVAYALAVIGILVSTRGRPGMRRHGLALVAVATTVGAIVFLVAMPWFRDGIPSETARYYGWLGSGLDVLVAPLRDSQRILGAVLRPEPWLVVAGMIAGLGGLPLLRPGWLMLAAPPLVALLLSAHPPQAALILHYPLILYVPIIVAAALGARRVLAIAARRSSPAGITLAGPILGAWVVACTLAVAWWQGPLPPFAARLPASLIRASGVETLATVTKIIPADAPVVADEGLVAHLAARPRIRRLAEPGAVWPDAYIVIDRDAWSASASDARRRAMLIDDIERGARPILADDARFVVFGPRSDVAAPVAP